MDLSQYSTEDLQAMVDGSYNRKISKSVIGTTPDGKPVIGDFSPDPKAGMTTAQMAKRAMEEAVRDATKSAPAPAAPAPAETPAAADAPDLSHISTEELARLAQTPTTGTGLAKAGLSAIDTGLIQ